MKNPISAPPTSAVPFRLGLLAVVCTPFCYGGPIPSPTHTAKNVSGTASVTGGGFENTAVTTGSTVLTSWNGWTFTGQSGVVVQGTSYASGQIFGQQTRGAFLQGVSSVSRTTSLSAGTWAVSFQAGQRLQSGTPDSQILRISVGGSVLFSEKLEGGLKYMTSRPFEHSGGNVTLSFEGTNGSGAQTALLDDVKFARVGLWNDTNAWVGGSVPSTTSHNVLIPVGVMVAMQPTANVRVGHIHVQGSLGAVDPGATGASELGCWSMIVDGPAAEFVVGRDGSEHLGQFTLKLWGTAVTEDIVGFGTKVLGAQNGALVSLHGRPVNAYGGLSATVNAGATKIRVFNPGADGWQVGEEIWISSTSGPVRGSGGQEGWDENEYRTITAIADVGSSKEITLNSPLTYKHISRLSSSNRTLAPAKNWQYRTRANVANMKRTVKITGMSPGTNGFGGHVMIMGEVNSGLTAAGVARIKNVELTHMGQKGLLGRYPFHWHMLADKGAGQYFNNNVVRDSFNRAIVIHGTHYTQVADNVAVNHVGHGMFLEDGAEIDNVIERNLVALSMRPPSGEEVIPSDNQFIGNNNNASPSAFWVSHPQNTFTDNIAANSRGSGYWFVFNNGPTGASSNDSRLNNLDGRSAALTSFVGNSAYCLEMAFDVNDKVDGSTFAVAVNHPWNPPGPQTLSDFKMWGNHMAIYTGLGTPEGQIYFDNNQMIGNQVVTRFASYHHVTNSLIVADTPDDLRPGTVVGVNLYDGSARFENIHWVGWNATDAEVTNPGGGTGNRANWIFSGNSYNHSGYARLKMPTGGSSGGLGMDSIIDIDGTLSGHAQHTVVSGDPILSLPGDPAPPSIWTAGKVLNANVCSIIMKGGSASPAIKRVDNDNAANNINFQTDTGGGNDEGFFFILDKPRYHYELTGFTADVKMLWADCVTGDSVVIVFPSFSSTATVTGGAASVSTLTALKNATVTSFYKTGSTVWFKYVRVSPSYSTTETFDFKK